jgi:hypothetical protein
MFENEVISSDGKEKVMQVLLSGQIQPLDDLYQVEAAAAEIQELEKKQDFLVTYKKKKIEDIEKESSTIKYKIAFFKDVIVATLKSNNEKGIKFPGFCSVSTRNNAGKWVIEDEDEFITWVEEAEKQGEKVIGVVEKVEQKNIVKKEADKLLSAWQQNGKLEELLKKNPQGTSSPVVRRELPKTSASITFVEEEKEAAIEVSPEVSGIKITKKTDSATVYDTI